ncbi:MAG TPA: hypothetical protein VKB51_06710, partial [bacterium]|nr:hypothetical protein [bacterium]
MKHSGRLLQVLTAGFAGLALTLVLGACAPVPGDGSGTSSDQLRSPLTDAQLQSLANDAWAES